MEQPKITILTEQGEELTPKEIKIDQDAAGVFLITITIDSADLVGWRTVGT